MPEKGIGRVVCELPGREGQWVEFRTRLKWKHVKQQLRFAQVASQLEHSIESVDPEALAAMFDGFADLLAHAIVDWNWTPEGGEEVLALPSENRAVLDELWQEEVMWLMGAMPGARAGEDAKNSESP